MCENYIANKEDFDALFVAASLSSSPKFSFIFAEPDRIKNVAIITFDSRNLFILTQSKLGLPALRIENDYSLYSIPHQEAITDKDQQGWMAGIRKQEFMKYLPSGISETDIISGGLLTPLTKIQASFSWASAYTTYESYIVTIVHEFAHIYFNSFSYLWYLSNKQTLPLLETAKGLFAGQSPDVSPDIMIPSYPFMTELFAFCTEYCVATEEFPQYKKSLDDINLRNMERYISQELERNIALQESVLYADYHIYAGVVGRILIDKYRNDWPNVLLKERNLDL